MLSPIVAYLTADIVQFRESMIQAGVVTNESMAKMSAATLQVNSAMVSLNEATLRVEAAQRRLAELQATGTATADELALAEQAVASAEDRAALAADRATLAHQRLLKAEGEAGLGAAGAAAQQEAAAAKTATGNATMLAGVGKLAAGTALAAGVIGYESIKAAGDFQSSMERIHTQAQVPQAEIGKLSDGILKLAGDVGLSPNSLAQSLFHIESAFESMPQQLVASGGALEVVRIAAEGAKVGNADLVDVTNALTAAMASGIPGVKDAAQTMGVLNAIVGVGDMNMQQLAKSFSSGAVANVKLYGSTIQDVGATLAVFGDNNIRAQTAGTQLRMAVQSLARPASTSAAALKTLGLSYSAFHDVMSKHGVVAALTLLEQSFKKAHIPAEEYGTFITDLFGKRAGAGIGILMGQYDRVMSKYPAMTKAAGTFGDAWSETQKTWNQQVDQMKGHLEAFGVSLGLKLITGIQKAVEWFGKGKDALVDWYKHNQTAQDIVKAFTGFWNGTFIPGIEKAWKIFKDQLTPALKELKAQYEANKPEIDKFLEIMGKTLGVVLILGGSALVTLLSGMAWFAGAAMATGVRALAGMLTIFQTMKGAVDALKGALSNLGGMLSGIGQSLASFGISSSMMGNLLHFEEGGTVPGAKGAPHLAVVHGGEYVVSNQMMASGKIGGNTTFKGGGLPGAGGGQPVVENHFYVDGQKIQATLQRQTLRYNQRNAGNGLALQVGR